MRLAGGLCLARLTLGPLLRVSGGCGCLAPAQRSSQYDSHRPCVCVCLCVPTNAEGFRPGVSISNIQLGQIFKLGQSPGYSKKVFLQIRNGDTNKFYFNLNMEQVKLIPVK